MMTNEKIHALREHMKKANVYAYLIPSSDPHMSEYLPERWKTRAYVSGFTGSVGTLLVTMEKSALWADGRYFIQAEGELAGSEVALMRVGLPDTLSVAAFLREEMPAKGRLGCEYAATATGLLEEILRDCADKEVSAVDMPFPEGLWLDRPAMPATEIWAMDGDKVGKTAAEKIALLREDLRKKGCDAMVVSRLDDVAWLLNLRGGDIAYTPVFLAYVAVGPEGATLYTNLLRLPEDIAADLESQGIGVKDYDAVIPDLQSWKGKGRFLVETAGCNYALYTAIEKNNALSIVEGDDPIQMLKSVKNEVEIANTIEAHVQDGCAMVRFQMDLERALARGEKLDEADVAEMVRRRRGEQPDFFEESFSTIAAYGPNAAMMHYAPRKETAAQLKREGFLLLDCGGQYRCGTTDITRTYALGEPTAAEKDYYTLVLNAHINMAMAVFPEGSAGGNIDAFARGPFWRRGLDYRSGTGHGVGYVGGVHEGPQSLRANNHAPLVANMVVTDEPGYYEEGKIGIRIENELLCRLGMETEYGRFLAFEVFTFCPIDTRAVQPEKLRLEQLDWLNAYHQMVYEKLAARLNEEERAWLWEKCAPLRP